MPDYLSVFYPESSFGGFSDVDGTVVFYGRINALIQPGFTVVDYGCGVGSHASDSVAFRRGLRSLRGKVSRVVGIDVDRAAQCNPCIDEFRALEDSARWPLPDAAANLIVCDSVLEHLEIPGNFFSEAARVLEPGGYLCVRTSNLLSYVGAAARLVPNRLHSRALRVSQPGRKEGDIFPTFYRCNTVRAVRRQMRLHGFRAAVYGYEAEPAYVSFAKLAYRLGTWHQKFAPAIFRAAVFGFGQLVGGRSAG